VIVYRQRAELLSAEADALLQGDEPVILPLMSARSSRLLFNQVQPTAPMFMAAISENVAATVPDAFSSTLRTALKPKADAILDEVAKQIRDVKRLEGL
jgi:uroporphyrinogen-III synthase